MRPACVLCLALGVGVARSAGAQPPPPPAPPSPGAPSATFETEAPATAPAETAKAPPPSGTALPPADTAPPPVPEPGKPPPVAETAAPPPSPAQPVERPASLPASARVPPRSERTLYVNFSALLAIHFRFAQYELERNETIEPMNAESDTVREQVLGGGGYELIGMIGSAKNGFAFGGAASFVYVGKTDYTWEGDDFPGYHPPIWALSLGPAVDYHPGRRFHIGGLFGLVLEGVPSFEPLPRKHETVPGIASMVWLGFEWAVSEDWNLGVCMTGHFRRSFHRDIPVESYERNSETSISIGLGVSVSRF